MRNRNLSDNIFEIQPSTTEPLILVADVPECEAIIWALSNKSIKVTAICDNIKAKSGRKSFGVEVIHTPSLPELYPDASFIIVSQQIQDCIEQLSSYGFSKFYSPLQALAFYQDSNPKTRPQLDPYTEARITVCQKSHSAFLSGKTKIYMRSLDVMVTTKCSLKCESCSNLMQYYQRPTDSSENEIIQSIETLSAHVDEIAEFRLIGGEPLMNKSWHLIAKRISDKYPDQEIFVYTNGTIAPRDDKLEIIKGRKVNFVITKYGYLSRNIDKLEDQLSKFKFSFETSDADFWVDCSGLEKHNRTPAELNQVFKQCCVKYLYTILDGKLFRCPFIANANKLGAIPDNKGDYVQLINPSDRVATEIRKLVGQSHFFPGCDFCVGRPYDATDTIGYDGKGIIKAGKQTSEILPYKLAEMTNE